MTICCPTKFNELKNKFGGVDPKENWHVFLAGPIFGAEKWQHNMPNIDNVTWFSPRRESYKNFNYDEQVDWEEVNMRFADVILFWVPKPTKMEELEKRNYNYAQTTRTEFGEYIARGKKIIFGCYDEFGGKNYFQKKLEQYHMGNVHSSLEDCIASLVEYIDECEKSPKVYFTSDTHFGSERTLQLSKRPFLDVKDMDFSLIENWNNTVHPCDKIYHLGDFGETEYSRYLNGTLHFLQGNYEREGKSQEPSVAYIGYGKFSNGGYHSLKGVNEKLSNGKSYILTHEPSIGLQYKNELNLKDSFILFGHIHGTQKCKKFGYNVGVDANNYKPISIDEIEYYRNAIENGGYDEEVWVN